MKQNGLTKNIPKAVTAHTYYDAPSTSLGERVVRKLHLLFQIACHGAAGKRISHKHFTSNNEKPLQNGGPITVVKQFGG